MLISEHLTPAKVDLGRAELRGTLSSLNTHLGNFIASSGFSSDGRQDARLSLGFLWDVLEWGSQLNVTIFTTYKLILPQSLGLESIQRKDTKLNVGQKYKTSPWIDSAIYLVSFLTMTYIIFSMYRCIYIYVHIYMYM